MGSLTAQAARAQAYAALSGAVGAGLHCGGASVFSRGADPHTALPSRKLSARTQAHVFLSAPNEAKEPRRQGASFRIAEQRPVADDVRRVMSSPRGGAH